MLPTNRKKCLQLPTYILFTSTSLRIPHSRSSVSSLRTSFLSMVQTSKSVSPLSNFCATISSTSTFQALQRPTTSWMCYILDAGCDLMYVWVKVWHPSKPCIALIYQKIWFWGTLVNVQPSEIYKLRNRAQLSHLAHAWWNITVEIIWINVCCASEGSFSAFSIAHCIPNYK